MPATLPDPDILARVRRLEITARRLVNDVFSGRYASGFRGQGMEFAEVREYLPGDDVRAIDWNVTARLGHPYIKRFVEERELTVLLVVDASASLDFGSRGSFKNELAARVAAVLAFTALRQGDKVGLMLFTDRVEHFRPPRKSRSHALGVIRDILAFRPQGRGTSLKTALETLSRVQRRRAVVFVISDFLDAGYDHALAVAARRHDLVAVPVSDPWEDRFPTGVRILTEDAETGRTVMVNRPVDTNGAIREALEKRFRRAGIEAVFLTTGEPFVEPFLRFFRERARRLR
jgi:uncharacterized protein (DUF58 family)